MSKELFQDQRVWEQSNSDNPVENVITFMQNLSVDIEEGNKDAIVAFAALSKIEKALKTAKEIVYKAALKEAEDYPEKTFTHKGVTVERRNGRKVFSFKHIQEWNDLTTNVKNRESLYKSAFDSYTKGAKMFDEETGEEIPVPVVTFTNDVLVIKS